MLTIYGLIQLILMLCTLPETLAKQSSFSFLLLCDRSKTLLTSSLFVGSVLISAFVYSSIIVFNTIGPFLIQKVLGRTSVFYGYMALLMGMAFFIGNSINKNPNGICTYSICWINNFVEGLRDAICHYIGNYTFFRVGCPV